VYGSYKSTQHQNEVHHQAVKVISLNTISEISSQKKDDTEKELQ
jgi:hypothetical protein